MTRNQLYYYLRRIYAVLRDEQVEEVLFEKMRGYYGWIDNGSVVLDHRKQLLSTFVHECLHEVYPEWPESKVEWLETMIMANIGPTQVKNLLTALVFLLHRQHRES